MKRLIRFAMSALLVGMMSTATTNWAQALHANGKIAFTSDRDGNLEIYVMNADGTDQVRLTNSAGVDDFPTFSPDGTRIAFVSQNAAGLFTIKAMNVDGTGQVEITTIDFAPTPYPWHQKWSLSWSPDNTKIAFQQDEDIFTIDVSGTNLTNLTNHTADNIEPAWSPDGSRILFISSRDPFMTIHAMNADGSNVNGLPSVDDFWDMSPAWSPLGDRIVFIVHSEITVPSIHIANADGSNRQVFKACDNGMCSQHPNKPTWSPDGTSILFHEWEYFSNHAEIYVKSLSGQTTRLTNTAGNNFNPSWQPLVSLACSNPNLIDCPDFFIRQQYRDFLGREPESSCPPNQCGLDFYLPIMNGCSDNIECTRYTRGALSANFFRSPEFGGKGAYVANLFNIVIGQRPKTVGELNDASKVERPHYAEFTTDLSTLSAPTDTETNQKKDQLAGTWLGRTEVQSILPSSLTNQQFVQKLETIAGVTLANEDALIANLNSGTQERAQVLRAVAESPEVIARFYTQNFVTMEYFGYLRRDPEDCHASFDPANCGYIFHNSRFNTPGANPDLIENIIVRGFIESPEYRGRFGLP